MPKWSGRKVSSSEQERAERTLNASEKPRKRGEGKKRSELLNFGLQITDCGTEWNDIACHRQPVGTLRRQRALRIGAGVIKGLFNSHR